MEELSGKPMKFEIGKMHKAHRYFFDAHGVVRERKEYLVANLITRLQFGYKVQSVIFMQGHRERVTISCRR